jgi:hypothetical protein
MKARELKTTVKNAPSLRYGKVSSFMCRWLTQKNWLFNILLSIMPLWILPSFAGDDSLNALQPILPQNVLIVKGDSYLENAVSAILKDSLSVKRFAVKIIPLASLKSEQPSNYRATIIMNAVHTSKVSGIVRSYARAQGAGHSNILICTVYGEEWKTGKTLSDAVTAATKTITPSHVAAKIVSLFTTVTQPPKPPPQQ